MSTSDSISDAGGDDIELLCANLQGAANMPSTPALMAMQQMSQPMATPAGLEPIQDYQLPAPMVTIGEDFSMGPYIELGVNLQGQPQQPLVASQVTSTGAPITEREQRRQKREARKSHLSQSSTAASASSSVPIGPADDTATVPVQQIASVLTQLPGVDQWPKTMAEIGVPEARPLPSDAGQYYYTPVYLLPNNLVACIPSARFEQPGSMMPTNIQPYE